MVLRDNVDGGGDDLVEDLYSWLTFLDFFWCLYCTLPTPTINHILYDLNISPFQQFSGGKVIPWKLETLSNTWNSENCQNYCEWCEKLLRTFWKWSINKNVKIAPEELNNQSLEFEIIQYKLELIRSEHEFLISKVEHFKFRIWSLHIVKILSKFWIWSYIMSKNCLNWSILASK